MTSGHSDRAGWSTNISAHLTGHALEVYSRMASADALGYDMLKEALLKRHQMTEEGLCSNFLECKVEDGEIRPESIVTLILYYTSWVDLTKVTRCYAGLFEMMLKEDSVY